MTEKEFEKRLYSITQEIVNLISQKAGDDGALAVSVSLYTTEFILKSYIAYVATLQGCETAENVRPTLMLDLQDLKTRVAKYKYSDSAVFLWNSDYNRMFNDITNNEE